MSESLRPQVSTFVREGRDDPRAGIVATFTKWGASWMWEVTYHLSATDTYVKGDAWYVQHIVENAYVVGTDNVEAWCMDNVMDLRDN